MSYLVILKQIKMKNFLYYVNEVLDWIMNLMFAVILIGGGYYVIKDIFF